MLQSVNYGVEIALQRFDVRQCHSKNQLNLLLASVKSWVPLSLVPSTQFL